MSDATRAIALQQAVLVCNQTGEANADSVLETAEKFHTFMTADSKPTPAQTSSRATSGQPAVKPAAPGKPAAAKPATAKPAAAKPAVSEEATAAAAVAEGQAEAAASDGEEAPETDTVGGVIGRLLAAGKRKECIALLKKFGATSASGVKAKDADSFIGEALGLLLAG